MKHDHISFQDYNMDQLYLPMDLEVEIPTHHACRIVNRAVEELDENILYRCYDGGGRPPYHPKMMLKIILYAYTQKMEWGLLCIAHNFLKWETHLRLKEQKEIKREPKAG